MTNCPSLWRIAIGADGAGQCLVRKAARIAAPPITLFSRVPIQGIVRPTLSRPARVSGGPSGCNE